MLKRILKFVFGEDDDPGLRRVLRRFGFGRASTVVREAANDPYAQEELLLPENKSYLRAFVKSGYTFSKSVLVKFISLGDKNCVLRYLERIPFLEEDGVMAVLKRKDEELVQLLLDQKLWCPFPYGCTSSIVHHEQALNEAVQG